MDIHYSPFDFGTDPYPVYARLREEAPLYRNEADDFWALSRHADVAAALRDAERFSSRNGLRLEPAFWGPDAERFFSFVAMDPPKHTRMRSLVARAFTPKRVRSLEPRLREIARGHLEPLLAAGGGDVMEFAARYPTDVISELVGVPVADRDHVRELGSAIMYRPETSASADLPPEALAAIGALVGYYTELTIARNMSREDDLLSDLIDASEGADRLTPQEIVGVLILLVGAGIETSMLLLGNALNAVALRPSQKGRALGGEIEPWIEETLRHDPPSQALARTTTEPVELHGETIPADARILLLTGSANRDPAVFAEPDVFDLDRDTSASLAFGIGRHHCIGAHLGRLEARVALGELTAAISDFELDLDAAQRIHSSNDRGFHSLPAAFTAR